MGRVPLHRRGTSKTYERLEDLLREAGYKETRIFTPEAERKRKGKRGEDDEDDDDTTIVEEKRASVMKDGVGAVMGFLAGLVNVGIPGVTGGKNATTASPPNSTSGSPSPTRCLVPSPPLANNVSTEASQPHPHPEIVVHPTTPPTPHSNHRPNHQLHRQDQHPHQLQESRDRNHHHQNHNQRLPSYDRHSSIHPNQNANRLPSQKGLGLSLGVGLHQQNGSGCNGHHAPNTTTLVSPRPSRATAYLRHISSVPNMMPPVRPRPHSTPVHASRPHHSTATANHSTTATHNSNNTDRSKARSNARRTLNLNIDTEYNSEDPTPTTLSHAAPPLPPTWLETVARAVLFGGAGAHIGGPLGSEGSSASLPTGITPNHPSSDPRRVESRQVQRQLRPSRSSISQTSQHHHHRPAVKSPLSCGDDDGPRTAVWKRRSGLSDQTNLTPTALPPALFSSVSKRNLRGEVEVSLTRVICRSAPGSRAGSVVRSSGEEGRGKRKRVDLDGWGGGGFDFGMGLDGDLEESLRGRGRVKRGWFGAGDQEVARKKEKKKKKDKEHVRVPSLARTKVEGDVWAKTQQQGKAKAKADKSRVNSSKPKPKATTTGYNSYASTSEVGEGAERAHELFHNVNSSHIPASSDTEASSHNDEDEDEEDDDLDHSYDISASSDVDEEEEDSDDNSESEPTLARMLLHPPAPHRRSLNSQPNLLHDGQLSLLSPHVAKRQQSIKSLRRVLARGAVPSASTSGS